MFLRQIAVIVIALSIALPIFADEDNEAMFGLQWGMTLDAVTSMGISITKEKGSQNLENYVTSSLPKNLSDIEKYILVFSPGFTS